MTIKDKEVTQLAMKKRREAHMVRLNGMSKYSGFIDERVAKSIEAEAETMLAVDELPITALGEVSHPHISGLWEQGKGLATDTLKMAGIVPEEASIKRTDLLLQESLDIASMALDASNSIKADNSLEKMLAHQMVAAHELMMKSANSAMNELEKLLTWKTLIITDAHADAKDLRINQLEEKVKELEKRVRDLDWLKKVLEAGEK